MNGFTCRDISLFLSAKELGVATPLAAKLGISRLAQRKTEGSAPVSRLGHRVLHPHIGLEGCGSGGGAAGPSVQHTR